MSVNTLTSGSIVKDIASLSAALALAICASAGSANAAVLLDVSGFLNDPGNAHLVGSGPAPDGPLFTDDFDIANNVAVYALTLVSPAAVTFESLGFAAGGVDPYFTLFAGATPAVATFVASNFGQAFGAGGDFLITLPLVAGDYLLALGAFANMSFAENLGAGTFADGFIGLGEPDVLGNSYYRLNVRTTTGDVPEPTMAALLAAGLGMLVLRRAAL